jgi:hypothetical protein
MKVSTSHPLPVALKVKLPQLEHMRRVFLPLDSPQPPKREHPVLHIEVVNLPAQQKVRDCQLLYVVDVAELGGLLQVLVLVEGVGLAGQGRPGLGDHLGVVR